MKMQLLVQQLFRILFWLFMKIKEIVFFDPSVDVEKFFNLYAAYSKLRLVWYLFKKQDKSLWRTGSKLFSQKFWKRIKLIFACESFWYTFIRNKTVEIANQIVK